MQVSLAQESKYIISAKLIDSSNLSQITNFSITVIDVNHRKQQLTYRIIGEEGFKCEVSNFQLKSIKINSLGYKEFNFSYLKNKLNDTIKLGTIFFKSETIKLKEVTIKNKVKNIELDTIKYSFKDSVFNRSIMTNDVLKLIPNLKIIDGVIYYEGKIIDKLKVNGQTFFFNDRNFTLNNLPGFAINNVLIVKPNKNRKNYTNAGTSIDLLLKKKSSNGYLSNSLLSYGLKKVHSIDFFLGKLDSAYQFGINLDHNNINDENPLLLSKISLLGGLNMLINTKINFKKRYKNLDIESNFKNTYIQNENNQEIERLDNINGVLRNLTYSNSTSSALQRNILTNTLEFKPFSGNQLNFNQRISFGKSNYENLSFFTKDGFSPDFNVIKNENNNLEIDHSLDYLYKDLNNQDKILSIKFKHHINDFIRNGEINQLSNIASKHMFSNEFNIPSEFTYIFNKKTHLVISLDQNINLLKTNLYNLVNTNQQIYNKAGIKFSSSIKKINYSIELNNYNYSSKNNYNDDFIRYNKFMPTGNISYSPKNGIKLTINFNQIIVPVKLEQLAMLSQANSYIQRIDNFNIIPENSKSYELNFEKFSNNKNLFFNAGYIKRINIAENSISNEITPVIVFKNTGELKTHFINIRCEIGNNNFNFSSLINYNYSQQKSLIGDLYLNTKTNLLEANFTIRYNIEKKINIKLTQNFTKSLRSYGSFENSKYLTNTIVSSLKFSYNPTNDISFQTDSDIQYNHTNIGNNPNSLNSIIDLLFQKQFLKNKNFILFFKIHNLLNNNQMNFQEYTSTTSIQSVKIKSIGRFYLLGLTYKFNTLKN